MSPSRALTLSLSLMLSLAWPTWLFADEDVGSEPPEDAPENKPSAWTNELSLSLISISGNAQSVTTKLNASSRGDWRDWGAELRVGGAYGQARLDEEQVPIARNGDVRLRGERRLADRLRVYLLSGVSADHLSSVEYQVYGESGLTLTWVEILFEDERPRLRLRTDLGFRAARESRFQYFPVRLDLDDRDIYALSVGAELRYVLTEGTSFTQIIEILPDVVVLENVRILSTSTVAVQVVEGLAVQVAFQVRHAGLPAEGRQPTDTELQAGVALTF